MLTILSIFFVEISPFEDFNKFRVVWLNPISSIKIGSSILSCPLSFASSMTKTEGFYVNECMYKL